MSSTNRVGRTLGTLLLLHVVVGLTVPFILLHVVTSSRGFLLTASENARAGPFGGVSPDGRQRDDHRSFRISVTDFPPLQFGDDVLATGTRDRQVLRCSP